MQRKGRLNLSTKCLRQIGVGCTLLCLLLMSPLSHSDDLRSLYQEALQFDPILQAAEAEYRAERLEKPLARSALLPQLNYSASYYEVEKTYRDASDLFADADFKRNYQEIELRQPLFRWDLIKKFSEAEYAVAAAKAGIESARQDMMFRLVGAYIDVLKAQNNRRLADLESKVLKKQLDESYTLTAEGMGTITDQYQYQAKYDLAMSKSFETEDTLALRNNDLSQITGHLPVELKPIQLKSIPYLREIVASKLDHWQNLTLKNNRDIQQSKFEYLAAEQRHKSAQAAYLPTVDLRASYSEQEELEGFNRGTASDTRFGVELELPLFSGMETTLNAEKTKHLLTKAKKDYLRIQQSKIAEVRRTYARIHNGRQKISALLRALKSTRQSLQGAQKAASVGTRTSSDVQLAIQDVYKAKRDYAEALYDLVLDSLTMKQLSGEFDVSTIEQLAP